MEQSRPEYGLVTEFYRILILNIMKLRNIFRILSAGVVLSLLASCHNKEQIFPDYEGGVTAYFAYQYPVKTIVLGESETFDTSLDNQHKCIIYGTMGGAYKGKDIVIDIEVDNTLAENLYFDAECTQPVKAMPSEYYKLAGNQLDYGGTHMGGVEVQLTDAFFADPDAIKNTYVIPVVMTDIVKGADQINDGEPLIEGDTPIRTDPTYWNKTPMDYTLYCVKYINEWDGSWLRRGVDQITDNGVPSTNVRHEQYIESDEVMTLTTQSLQSVVFPITTNVTIIREPDPEYALSLSNATAGENNWGLQVWYNFDEPLVSGKTYTFSAMTKGTSEYTSSVFLQQSDGDAQQYGAVQIPFTTEWTKVSADFSPSNDGFNKFTLNIGDFEGTLWLDKVSIVEKGQSDELILNGDFLGGTAEKWQSWSGFQAVTADGYTEKPAEPVIEVIGKTCDLLLTFDGSGNATVSSATEGVTASGSGKFVKDGEKKAWGNKDRDAIYLEYDVDFGTKQYHTRDTLVSRSREIVLETYSPTYKK